MTLHQKMSEVLLHQWCLLQMGCYILNSKISIKVSVLTLRKMAKKYCVTKNVLILQIQFLISFKDVSMRLRGSRLKNRSLPLLEVGTDKKYYLEILCYQIVMLIVILYIL